MFTFIFGSFSDTVCYDSSKDFPNSLIFCCFLYASANVISMPLSTEYHHVSVSFGVYVIRRTCLTIATTTPANILTLVCCEIYGYSN